MPCSSAARSRTWMVLCRFRAQSSCSLLFRLNGGAIVTSCTRELASVRIHAAGLPVPPTIITSSDITNGKPHAEPYLKGAQALGFAAAECVAFEDVPAGIRSAKAAGGRAKALRTAATETAPRARV